jgi:phasin family protein
MNLPKDTAMNKAVEQFTAAAKDNLAALQTLATKAQADAAKLVELNLATSKEVLAESFETAKAMMAAKDPQALAALQVSLVKPLADKAAAYAQQVQSIVSGASADFTKTAQANLAEAQKGFTSLMASTTQNAPAGTESVMAFFNQAMEASQNAFKTAQSSAQQALDTAQSNFSAVSKQAVDAVKKASK